jgi:hypothetical protein
LKLELREIKPQQSLESIPSKNAEKCMRNGELKEAVRVGKGKQT